MTRIREVAPGRHRGGRTSERTSISTSTGGGEEALVSEVRRSDTETTDLVEEGRTHNDDQAFFGEIQAAATDLLSFDSGENVESGGFVDGGFVSPVINVGAVGDVVSLTTVS